MTREARTRQVLDEMFLRKAAGHPVTQDLIDRLPRDMRVEMPTTIYGPNGPEATGTIVILNGKISFKPSLH